MAALYFPDEKSVFASDLCVLDSITRLWRGKSDRCVASAAQCQTPRFAEGEGGKGSLPLLPREIISLEGHLGRGLGPQAREARRWGPFWRYFQASLALQTLDDVGLRLLSHVQITHSRGGDSVLTGVTPLSHH